MKLTIVLGILLIALVGMQCEEKQEVESTEPAEKRAVMTGMVVAGIVTTVAPMIHNIFKGFLNNIIGPKDYQDTIIFNRSMRIKNCGENCVHLLDRASGVVATGKGASLQEAIGEATKLLYDELLTKKILTLFDLCSLHITYPHPNQEKCKGIQISTCDLVEWHKTTQAPCTDKLGLKYCTRQASRCDEYVFQAFLRLNCLKTCSNGKCSFEEKSDDPCSVSDD